MLVGVGDIEDLRDEVEGGALGQGSVTVGVGDLGPGTYLGTCPTGSWTTAGAYDGPISKVLDFNLSSSPDWP